jgi:hypothetical protein
MTTKGRRRMTTGSPRRPSPCPPASAAGLPPRVPSSRTGASPARPWTLAREWPLRAHVDATPAAQLLSLQGLSLTQHQQCLQQQQLCAQLMGWRGGGEISARRSRACQVPARPPVTLSKHRGLAWRSLIAPEPLHPVQVPGHPLLLGLPPAGQGLQCPGRQRGLWGGGLGWQGARRCTQHSGPGRRL